MKRWNNYVVIGLMLLVVGCQKNQDVVSLRVEQEQFRGGGKVCVDSDSYACWMNGDSVNINNKGYVVEVSNEGTRINNVEVNDMGYTAMYPNRYVKGVSRDKVEFDWPSGYEYKNAESGEQVLLNPMVARTNTPTGSLMFKNVGALVGIQLKNNVDKELITIDKIQLMATNTEVKLSGKAVVTPSIGEAETDVTIVNGGNKMVLWGINKSLNGGEAATFYLNIPSVMVEGNQFMVRVLFHAGEQYYEFDRTTSTKVGKIDRNQMGTIPIDLSAEEGNYVKKSSGLMGTGEEGNPYIVSDSKDLIRLKDYCNATNSAVDISVQQVSNVVCSENWEGIGSANGSSVYSFNGHYDGGGYSITLNNTQSGVFNYVGGGAEIKNVVVKGNINAKNKQYIGGLINQIKSTSNKGILINNCVNESKICLSDDNEIDKVNGSRWIGGLCGRVGSKGIVEINNSVNCGSLECNVDNNVGNSIYMGGLCGYKYDEGKLKLNKCWNKGQVKFVNGGSYRLGGCIGYSTGDIDIIQFANDGEIIGKTDGMNNRTTVLGGVIGEWNAGNNLLLQECVNHGGVNSACWGGGLIGAIYASRLVNMIDCYNDGNFNNCIGCSGIIDSCHMYQGSLNVSNCYATGKFDNCAKVSWIVRVTTNITTMNFDCIYIQDTNYGVVGTKKNMNIDNDDDIDVFLIDNNKLAGDLNENRTPQVWVKDDNGKVRLAFEVNGF